MRRQGLFVLVCAVTAAVSASAQTQIINTVAGGGSPIGLAATNWSAKGPAGAAVDTNGNLYIALSGASQVWVVNSSGIVTKVIGNGISGYAGDGGPASAAQLQSPYGLALDSAGNLYIADYSSNAVREVSASTGNISTVAGNGIAGYHGDGAAATSAELSDPVGVAVDSAGNVYIADAGNYRIREVSASTGNISTIAGNGTDGSTGDGGPAASAELDSPTGIAFDANGNLYFAEYYASVIREISMTTGNISTVAGNGTAGYGGDGGAAISAELYRPYGVALDPAGNLYIADEFNFRIREVSASTGNIGTVAGTGTNGFSGDGAAATGAELSYPALLALDSTGNNLYIPDYGNNRIRKVSAGIITTFAGNGTNGYGVDGIAATGTQLSGPTAVAVDSKGNLYIADAASYRIREVSASTGNISTIAGNGTQGYSGDGALATSAELNGVYGIALDLSGNLYVADTFNQVIRKVSATTGNISTIAGNGMQGYNGDGAVATGAEFGYPLGLALDSGGNLYIADVENCAVRMVSAATGKISTVAGNGTCGYSGDGGAATAAQLGYPEAVAFDPGGNLYIADTRNAAIRRVSASTGNISTVAGNDTAGYSGDGGPATSAQLSGPQGVAVDFSGNLFISDTNNSVVREVFVSTGKIGTVAGNGTYGFSGDSGAATSAELAAPEGIAVSPAGRVYVADIGNSRIRAFPNPAAPVISWPSPAPIASGTALSATQLDAAANASGTFVFTPPAGTVLAQGNNQTLSVTFTPTDILDYTATTATTTINVAGTQVQTITFGPLSDQALNSPPPPLSANASSGLSVTFTSNTPVVCSVSGTTLTLLVSGGCSITVTQPGDNTYAPAPPVTQTFTIYFSDVVPADYYYGAVNLLAQLGITAGCGNNNYCATANVTRAQMAIFMVRAVYGSDNFTSSATPYFTDVQPADFGFRWIQKLYELGITAGCGVGLYCPNDSVTRDQMAIFIIRVRLGLALAGGTPTFTYSTTPAFTDEPASDFAFPWVQRMAEENITGGCGVGLYCPNTVVTRGDMAIFIMRGAFNQLLPAGTPVLTQISPATLARGTSGTYTITGANTNFVQGTTALSSIPGVTIGTIAVSSPTTMTVQLTAAANAVAQPYSILAITGGEQDVLPNGLVIQ